MESNATDKPVPREIIALLSDERLILRETQRAVTPFGGIAVFISLFSKLPPVTTTLRWLRGRKTPRSSQCGVTKRGSTFNAH